jgi:hypothetical protein
MRRKFRIGQSVNYRPAGRGQNAQPLGKYQVTRFLPQRSLSTIAAGVFLGTPMALQALASKPGRNSPSFDLPIGLSD